MTLFVSKPQHVEAVQWTGKNEADMYGFALHKVRVSATLGPEGASPKSLELLAGKDGAQEWVPVPIGHWIVHPQGDLSDVWPVDPDYFAAKYEPADPDAGLLCLAARLSGPDGPPYLCALPKGHEGNHRVNKVNTAEVVLEW